MQSRRISPRRLLGLGVFIAFAAQACSLQPWRACPPPCDGPALSERLAAAAEVRVHKTDGSVLDLTAVSVGRDPHGAFLAGTPVAAKTHRPAGTVTIRLEEVSLIETRRPEAARSWANLGVVVAVVAVAVVAVVAAGSTIGCPEIESFDGRQYRLQSETFAGAFAPSLERTTFHQLDALVPVESTYRVRLANRSLETDYVDQLALYAVEHPRGVTIAFTASGEPVTVREPRAPATAFDGSHRDVRAALSSPAGAGWESDVAALVAASRTTDELRLTFPRPAGAATAKLLLRARNTQLASRIRQDLLTLRGREAANWYAGLASSPQAAADLKRSLSGTWGWQVQVQAGGLPAALPLPDVGPIAARELALVFDVRGVTGDTLAFSLSGAAGVWQIESVAVDYSPAVPLVWKRLPLLDSRRDLLDEPDGRRLALLAGESLDIAFGAATPGPGMEITPVLATRGYLVPWLPDSSQTDRTPVIAWWRNPELARRHYLALR
jgi:hypothetical protein